MPLKPGDTLFNGQYCILRQLGRGGFGFVYEAQDTLLVEQVAVKELIPALVGDEAMLKRFLAEAKATMRLTHKRIVRTHAVFQEGEHYYIVMELMPGGSLEARLKEGGVLPVAEAVRVAAGVAEGLACAHEEGVVHCDLKPANILFDKKGEAKVADFGIAHVSGEMLTRSWHTPAGFVAGTLPYMSPEQVDGVRDDPRVDVYALGAVLYRMLTGRTYLDFDERETPRAQSDNVQRICSQRPQPPSAHNRRVPPWLDQVVLKALAKQPGERYGSAEALRAALAPRPRSLAGPAPRTAPGRASGPKPTRPRWLLPLAGAAGGLLVVVLALIVWMLVGAPPSRQTALATSPTPEARAVGVTTATLPQPEPAIAGPSAIVPVPATPTSGALPQDTVPAESTDTARPTDTALPTTMPTPTEIPSITPDPTATPAPTLRPNTPTPLPAAVFQANFDGTRLDTARWGADAGDGEIIVSGGAVRLRSAGQRFPYLYTQSNPFPAEGDFVFLARFRYVWIRDCGVGVILSSYRPPPGLSQAEVAARQQEAEASGVQAGVWQDQAGGLQIWFRSGADREDVRYSGPDDDWHELQVLYTGGRYTLSLDGRLAYRSEQTPHRPAHIWLGHPAALGAPCWWSTLEVDSVRVERLAE
jgi:eukaryotic-like serine/threonine-protein kinase